MFKYLALIFLFLLSAYPQKKNDVAAEVGNEIISLKEFKTRFELMPKLSEAGFNTDTLKNEFIHSLIAEKLWAIEAEKLGMDTNSYFRASFGQLEKLFLQDALFKQEVESKIKISPQEIEKGITRSRQVLKVQIWSGDSSATFRINQLIKNGVTFDSLRITELDISYGQMDDDKVEDLLYALKPGEYSGPVKQNDSWFIFHLKNKSIKTGEDLEKLTSIVKNNIKERKAREIGLKFLAEFLKNVKASTDSALFRDLSLKITAELKNKTPDEFEKEEKTLFLSEESVKKISGSYSPEDLNSVFIRIENRNITLDDFFAFLRFDILSAKSPDQRTVMLRLKNKIDFFIEQELLSAEAKKRNLHLTSGYQEELKLWKESYLAQMLRTDYLSKLSVSDQEVYDFYLELSNRTDSVTHLNILEILTSDLQVVETVLNELKNGKDFRELASLYTEREWTKSKGGEFGLFPVNLYRDISEIAINMKVGDVYGPLKIQEGYSIFKLIEKKDPAKTFSSDFEAVKDQLRNDLTLKKYQSSAEEKTVVLAENYQVRINRDAIEKVPVSNVQMFAYRYMGFGGKISAVPYTTPWHTWRKKIDLKNM